MQFCETGRRFGIKRAESLSAVGLLRARGELLGRGSLTPARLKPNQVEEWKLQGCCCPVPPGTSGDSHSSVPGPSPHTWLPRRARASLGSRHRGWYGAGRGRVPGSHFGLHLGLSGCLQNEQLPRGLPLHQAQGCL